MIIIDKETVFAISILQSYDFFSEHRLRLPKKCCPFPHSYAQLCHDRVRACVYKGLSAPLGVAYRARTPNAIRPYGIWCTGVWHLEYDRIASAVRSINGLVRVGK